MATTDQHHDIPAKHVESATRQGVALPNGSQDMVHRFAKHLISGFETYANSQLHDLSTEARHALRSQLIQEPLADAAQHQHDQLEYAINALDRMATKLTKGMAEAADIFNIPSQPSYRARISQAIADWEAKTGQEAFPPEMFTIMRKDWADRRKPTTASEQSEYEKANLRAIKLVTDTQEHVHDDLRLMPMYLAEFDKVSETLPPSDAMQQLAGSIRDITAQISRNTEIFETFMRTPYEDPRKAPSQPTR